MKNEPAPDTEITDVSVLEPAALGPIVAGQPMHIPQTYWGIVGTQFRKNKLAVSALALVVVLLAMAFSADFLANDKPLFMKFQGQTYLPIVKDYAVRLGISHWQREFQNVSYKEFAKANFKEGDWAWFPPIRYSPTDIDLNEAIQPPSSQHFLGTDEIGRDVASRMIHGARVSLSVGFVAVGIYVLIGVLVGALAGYYGGVADIVASRLIEVMLTIPTFFLIITVVAFLPQSVFNIMVVIGITSWPTVARLARGEFLRTK